MLARPSLTLKRYIKAAPQKVFDAWTNPAQMSRWFGPHEAPAARAEADLRVGGRYTIVMNGKDGEVHQVCGTYREIVPGERLVFTWAWVSTPERESLVTVAFRQDGDGTMLTLTHEQFFDEAARDGHNKGWIGTLDRLEALFA